MLGKKISELPKLSSFLGEDLMVVEQHGVTKSSTIEDLKKVMKGDTGAQGIQGEPGEKVDINDGVISTSQVWSSVKTSSEIDKKANQHHTHDISEIGGSISNTTYIHNQLLPSLLWFINHNMGKYPSVTATDSSGNQVMGDVRYISSNTLEIKFTSVFSGKAYIN